MASEERAAVVLALVRGLVAEVHPHASRLTVTLDSPFDDLGIGSLELVELLLRVQDAFGVALPSARPGQCGDAAVISCGPSPGAMLAVGEDVGVVSPPPRRWRAARHRRPRRR